MSRKKYTHIIDLKYNTYSSTIPVRISNNCICYINIIVFKRNNCNTLHCNTLHCNTLHAALMHRNLLKEVL